jgi:glycosyltransferase involved in cell wall biosynthesis
MKASIIIPTYNGAGKITSLLESLASQTVRDFEVIVVIDGSTDKTLEVLRIFEKSFPNFRILVQENRGRAAARNAGVSKANMDLLIFYDDDMKAGIDSVARHIQFHQANHLSSILAGNQSELPGRSDIQNYKAYLTQCWFSKFHEEVTELSFHNLFFAAANCSVPKGIFQNLNGFDERLSDVEDFDFAFRAANENIPVYFDKRNTAIHMDQITCVGYVKRLRQYAKAKQKWYEFHPNERSTDSRSSRKFLYLPFASAKLAQAIDRDLFSNFPRKWRYKLYDAVIQALAIEFPKKRIE